MQKGNLFSANRFILLIKHSLIVNKKLIGISVAGVTGTLFIALFFFQSVFSFQNWTNLSTTIFFLFCYVSLGGMYTSQSFPAFRSKGKSLGYLMLPASSFEKFIYEFLVRIVALILLFPILFWIVANAEGSIIHHYIPKLVSYRFSFSQGIPEFISKWKMSGWDVSTVVQVCLFVYFSTFTGACHFSKSPRIKTLFTLSVIIAGYTLFTYLLFKGLNLKDFRNPDNEILFIKSKEGIKAALSIGWMIVNLTLLSIAWFRFKEKEV